MPKRFYADFVKHCLRYYCRYPDITTHKNHVEETNWKACKSVLDTYNNNERMILMSFYTTDDDIKDVIARVSDKCKVEPKRVWAMLNNLERKVAERRGLI